MLLWEIFLVKKSQKFNIEFRNYLQVAIIALNSMRYAAAVVMIIIINNYYVGNYIFSIQIFKLIIS